RNGDFYKGMELFSMIAQLPFTGELTKGELSGKGKLSLINSASLTYSGKWKQNCPHGFGVEIYYFDDMKSGEYEGTYHMGLRHGCGSFTFPNQMAVLREYRFG